MGECVARPTLLVDFWIFVWYGLGSPFWFGRALILISKLGLNLGEFWESFEWLAHNPSENRILHFSCTFLSWAHLSLEIFQNWNLKLYCNQDGRAIWKPSCMDVPPHLQFFWIFLSLLKLSFLIYFLFFSPLAFRTPWSSCLLCFWFKILNSQRIFSQRGKDDFWNSATLWAPPWLPNLKFRFVFAVGTHDGPHLCVWFLNFLL